MNNYFANIEAIAHGKGSSQARDEGCGICWQEIEEEEKKPDWDGWFRCLQNEHN